MLRPSVQSVIGLEPVVKCRARWGHRREHTVLGGAATGFLFASNQSDRNPTEFCWRVRAEFWVKLLGFAPASLHPTYDLDHKRRPAVKCRARWTPARTHWQGARLLFAGSERNPTEWVFVRNLLVASLHPTYSEQIQRARWRREHTGWVERQRAFICRLSSATQQNFVSELS